MARGLSAKHRGSRSQRSTVDVSWARAFDVNGDGFINQNDLNIPGPTNPNADAALAPSEHFSLTAPFEPQERARQLVFFGLRIGNHTWTLNRHQALP